MLFVFLQHFNCSSSQSVSCMSCSELQLRKLWGSIIGCMGNRNILCWTFDIRMGWKFLNVLLVSELNHAPCRLKCLFSLYLIFFLAPDKSLYVAYSSLPRLHSLFTAPRCTRIKASILLFIISTHHRLEKRWTKLIFRTGRNPPQYTVVSWDQRGAYTFSFAMKYRQQRLKLWLQWYWACQSLQGSQGMNAEIVNQYLYLWKLI